jgi:Flp pilus assembly protein TadG
MIALKTGNEMRSVASIQLNTASGMRSVASIQLLTPSGLRTVYTNQGASGSLALSSNEASGYTATKGSSQAYTNALTVSGFSSSATIVWTVPSGWSVINQGAATTAFRGPSLSPNDDISSEGSVTVTPGGTLSFSLYASNQGFGG